MVQVNFSPGTVGFKSILTKDQLVSNGIFPAMLLYVNSQLSPGDTITVTNDDGVPTTVEAGNQFLIGADIQETAFNLSSAITNNSGGRYTAIVAELIPFFPPNTFNSWSGFYLYMSDNTKFGKNDRVFGSLVVPDSIKILDFNGTTNYAPPSGTHKSLPSSDTTVTTFGFYKSYDSGTLAGGDCYISMLEGMPSDYSSQIPTAAKIKPSLNIYTVNTFTPWGGTALSAGGYIVADGNKSISEVCQIFSGSMNGLNIIDQTSGFGFPGIKICSDGNGKLSFFGATPQTKSGVIADAAGGGTIDAEARAAINALLAYLRLLGLVTA